MDLNGKAVLDIQEVYQALSEVMNNPQRYKLVQYETDGGSSENVNFSSVVYNRLALNITFIDLDKVQIPDDN